MVSIGHTKVTSAVVSDCMNAFVMSLRTRGLLHYTGRIHSSLVPALRWMKMLTGFSFTFKPTPESCVFDMLQQAEKLPLHYAGTQLLGNTHVLAGHTSLHTQHT